MCVKKCCIPNLRCEAGVCGPYILFNGLDILIEDDEVGGGVIWEDCRLNSPAVEMGVETGDLDGCTLDKLRAGEVGVLLPSID